MCTVSFIPKSNDDFILTSNRDESPYRKTLAPQFYKLNKVQLLFPKDDVAGGTWIGASKQKRLICLLNGGFIAHTPKEKYRMSRGVIVIDLLTAENLETKIKDYDFSDIEPFTIILVDWKEHLKLYELIWDGETIHFNKNPLVPTIWSSSLLYSEKDKKKREYWFSKFLNSNELLTEDNIIHFHKTAGEGNKETNLVMDRVFVKTQSITEFSKKNGICVMRYEDLSNNKINIQAL